MGDKNMTAAEYRQLARQETKAADAHEVLLEYARGIDNAKKIEHHTWEIRAHRLAAIALFEKADESQPAVSRLLATWSDSVKAAHRRDQRKPFLG